MPKDKYYDLCISQLGHVVALCTCAVARKLSACTYVITSLNKLAVYRQITEAYSN